MLPSPGLQAGREGKVKRGVERAKKRDWPLLKTVPRKVVARLFVRFGSAPVGVMRTTGRGYSQLLQGWSATGVWINL